MTKGKSTASAKAEADHRHLTGDLAFRPEVGTQAILKTLRAHEADRQLAMFDLSADELKHSSSDSMLKAYEYPDGWVNRLIPGDSLVVMNSLLEYEGLGGQVQMIYIDPRYAKFSSNFQPFVRKQDAIHNDEPDLTWKPELAKALKACQ